MRQNKYLHNSRSSRNQFIALALFAVFNCHAAFAGSFTLDRPSPSWPNSSDILRDRPGPVSALPRLGASSNTLGLLPGDMINALSDGRDPVDEEEHPGDHIIVFSVRRQNVGMAGTAVNAEFVMDTAPTGGPNGQASDLFVNDGSYASNALAGPPMGWAEGTQSGDESNTHLRIPAGNNPGDNVDAYDRRTMRIFNPDDFQDDNPDDNPDGNPDGNDNPGGLGVGVPTYPIFFSLRSGSPSLPLIPARPGDVLVVGGSFGPNPQVFIPHVTLNLPAAADLDALSLEVEKSTDGTLVPHRARFSVRSATTGFALPDGSVVDSGAMLLLWDGMTTTIQRKPDELGLLDEDDIDATETIVTVGETADGVIIDPLGDAVVVPVPNENIIAVQNIGSSGEDGVAFTFRPCIRWSGVFSSNGDHEGTLSINPLLTSDVDLVKVDIDLVAGICSFGKCTCHSGFQARVEAFQADGQSIIEDVVLEDDLVVQFQNSILQFATVTRPHVDGMILMFALGGQEGEDFRVDLPDAGRVVAQRIEVGFLIPWSELGSTSSALTGMEITGNYPGGNGQFTLEYARCRGALVFAARELRSVGDAHVNSNYDGNGVLVSQIGSSGLDGVDIDYPAAMGSSGQDGVNEPESLSIAHEGLTFAGTAGRRLAVTSFYEKSNKAAGAPAPAGDGGGAGVDEPESISATIEARSAGTASIEVDWAGFAETVHIEAYSGGAFTGTSVAAAGLIGRVRGDIVLVETSAGVRGFRFRFEHEITMMTRSGDELVGDEFHLLHESVQLARMRIGNVEITGALIERLVIRAIVGEAPRDGGFRRGDADRNSQVEISDAIVTLGFLFLGQGRILCEDAADSNDSGTIDIGDAINTLNYLFLGSGSVPAPGPKGCGVDPTKDALGCESYDTCS